MNNQEIIEKTKRFIKEKFGQEGSGHDYWHIYRVWKNARHIGNSEDADLFVVQIAALLHDIADFKFHAGNTTIGSKKARAYLQENNLDESNIKHICDIIETISFKGAGEEKPMKTTEGKVVRDADRLDALGAIGIARCFTYGGYKGYPIHNPDTSPKLHITKEEYLKRQTSQINHFYEKLLLLKDLMQAKTGRKLAEQRHKFMEDYLQQFFKEWGHKDNYKNNL